MKIGTAMKFRRMRTVTKLFIPAAICEENKLVEYFSKKKEFKLKKRMVLSIQMNVIRKAIPLNFISTKRRTVNLIRTSGERIPFPRSVTVSAAKGERQPP
jgi:hypothetical protein